MACYCDYDFYKNIYYGVEIKEDDFNRLAVRASDKLDQFTFDRLTAFETMSALTQIKVKKAVCALAETMQSIELAKQANSVVTDANGTIHGRAVSSVSAGSESINYVAANMMGQIVSDIKAQENTMYETVRPYLQGTGLLYAGV